MVTILLPDAMPDLRHWLRHDETLNPLHGGRVFFRLPNTLVAPFMRLTRLGGGLPTESQIPIQVMQLAVDIWGLQNQDYQAVRQLEAALEYVVVNWADGSILNPASNTRMNSVVFNSAFDSPDPETGWPRIITHLTAIVTATSPTMLAG